MAPARSLAENGSPDSPGEPSMHRWLEAAAVALACAVAATAVAQATDASKGASADAVYSNLGNYRNQSFAAGGATLQVFNTVTRMAADDLTLAGTPPYSVNGFRFVVT